MALARLQARPVGVVVKALHVHLRLPVKKMKMATIGVNRRVRRRAGWRDASKTDRSRCRPRSASSRRASAQTAHRTCEHTFACPFPLRCATRALHPPAPLQHPPRLFRWCRLALSQMCAKQRKEDSDHSSQKDVAVHHDAKAHREARPRRGVQAPRTHRTPPRTCGSLPTNLASEDEVSSHFVHEINRRAREMTRLYQFTSPSWCGPA